MFNPVISRFARLAALVALMLVALPSAASATDLAADGPLAPQPRIMGGGPITIDEVPWQVRLKVGYNSGNPSVFATCGGALLSATKVLTAAHCADSAQPNQSVAQYGIVVVAGITDFGANPPTRQERTVSVIRANPAYDARPDMVATTADLAVLEFATPLTLSAAVQPIRLPDPWTPTADRTPVPPDVRVSGWGKVDNDAYSRAVPGLKAVTMTVVSDPDLCTDPNENAIAHCVRSPLGSSCGGDSGGPLTTVGPNPVLVGIVSNGALCGANTDDFYVNLYAPENRAFIDGTPVTLAPRRASDTAFQTGYTLKVGSPITCHSGAFINYPTTTRVEFTKDDGTVIGSFFGTSATLTIPAEAGGSRISCRTYAANAGGTSLSKKVTTFGFVPAVAGGGGSIGTTPIDPSGACPNLGARAGDTKIIDTFIRKRSITSRRNRYAYAKIEMEGLPATPYVIRVDTTRTSTPYVPYSKTWDMEEGYDSIEWEVPLKVPKSAKIGRTYRYLVGIRQANSRQELRGGRACGMSNFTIKVRIKR